MTTTTIRAFVREPFDLALGQPHQMLISSASVAIVAAEAATLIPFPFNVALAIGAEWAYLRGLISGAGIKTPWAARLNVSAVLLVVLYGALWGFRSFHLIPDAPPAAVAVLLTLIHIGAIGAVTFCSAMLHRAGEDAKAELTRATTAREDARQQRIEDERAALRLEMERKREELTIWVQAQEAKARLRAAMPQASKRRAAHTLSESIHAADQACPKCGALLNRARWMAAKRWGYCSSCKEQ